MTWISDGDTIEVEGPERQLTVRLVAINTPDQGECFADDALDHLLDTLKNRLVALEVVGEDQFDRTLAHVFEGERHVNLELVAEGLAIASTPDGDDPYKEEILQAEETAYEAGEGLWGATACGSVGPLPSIAFDTGSSVTDPDGPDDADPAGEFVVIRSRSDTAIGMSGWVLRDESTRHRFTFPAGTALAPGETLTVSSADPGWDPGGGPIWNNDGDMALLLDANGTVVARWRY